jgi:hypothetical protein
MPNNFAAIIPKALLKRCAKKSSIRVFPTKIAAAHQSIVMKFLR